MFKYSELAKPIWTEYGRRRWGKGTTDSIIRRRDYTLLRPSRNREFTREGSENRGIPCILNYAKIRGPIFGSLEGSLSRRFRRLLVGMGGPHIGSYRIFSHPMNNASLKSPAPSLSPSVPLHPDTRSHPLSLLHFSLSFSLSLFLVCFLSREPKPSRVPKSLRN